MRIKEQETRLTLHEHEHDDDDDDDDDVHLVGIKEVTKELIGFVIVFSTRRLLCIFRCGDIRL